MEKKEILKIIIYYLRSKLIREYNLKYCCIYDDLSLEINYLLELNYINVLMLLYINHSNV